MHITQRAWERGANQEESASCLSVLRAVLPLRDPPFLGLYYVLLHMRLRHASKAHTQHSQLELLPYKKPSSHLGVSLPKNME